jgi:nitronate monooxygenase
MIRTPLTERLGITYPIIQAGVGGVARAELVAAVSNAGGLGVIGAGFMSPAQLRE